MCIWQWCKMVLSNGMECMCGTYKVLFTTQLSYPPPTWHIHCIQSHNETGMNLAGGNYWYVYCIANEMPSCMARVLRVCLLGMEWRLILSQALSS